MKHRQRRHVRYFDNCQHWIASSCLLTLGVLRFQTCLVYHHNNPLTASISMSNLDFQIVGDIVLTEVFRPGFSLR